MSSEKIRNVLLEAVRIAGEHNEDFDEVKLASQTNIKLDDLRELLKNKDLSPFFHVDNKRHINCPKCKEKVEIESLDYAMCKKCGEELDLKKESILALGLKAETVQEFFIEVITQKFAEKGFSERGSDKNFLVLKNKDGGQILALSFSIESNGLKDYFWLRGRANEYNPSMYIIVSNSFDKYLSSHKDKDFKCVLVKFHEIFGDSFISKLITDINKRDKVINKEKETEKKLKLKFRKFGDINKLEEHQSETINSITKRALQSMDGETREKQASKFEKDIVKILNFTILGTKYLAGNNETDGLGRILRHDGQKSKWYPIEIKSFTPKKESEPFYSLKDATVQIAKYIKAFKNEDTTSKFDIPAFILIAYDFDVKNKEEKKLIEDFKNRHNTELVLFPLKSIIRLLVGFHNNNIFDLPPDDIQKFIVKNEYIKPEQVDELIKVLVKKSKETYQEDLRIVRGKVKAQGV